MENKNSKMIILKESGKEEHEFEIQNHIEIWKVKASSKICSSWTHAFAEMMNCPNVASMIRKANYQRLQILWFSFVDKYSCGYYGGK